MMRNPCHYVGSERAEQATCPAFAPESVEDGIAWEQAVEESDRKMSLVLPVIVGVKQQWRGTNWSGSVPCPTGCGGTLKLTHAACNGHVWGKCSTDGCVAWME